MYIKSQHHNKERNEAFAFLNTQPFGLLIANLGIRSWGVHLPFILNADHTLSSHMAKANPLAQQWITEKVPEEVLVVFQGASGYISGSWYSQEEVSTYNYTALHVYAKVELLNQQETLSDLTVLMNTHEAQQNNPKFMSDYAPETLRQVNGVLGFKLSISEMHFAQKLSQERTEDRKKVIEQLETRTPSEQALAKDMKQLKHTP